MASAFKPNIRTYFANGAIPAYAFVQYDTTAPATSKSPRVVVCTSGKSIGISQNDVAAASGDEVEIALPGGGALLTAGGSITVGGSLKPTTNGQGIATTTAGDYVGAEAVEGGAASDIIGVHVVQWQKQSSDAT